MLLAQQQQQQTPLGLEDSPDHYEGDADEGQLILRVKTRLGWAEVWRMVVCVFVVFVINIDEVLEEATDQWMCFMLRAIFATWL